MRLILQLMMMASGFWFLFRTLRNEITFQNLLNTQQVNAQLWTKIVTVICLSVWISIFLCAEHQRVQMLFVIFGVLLVMIRPLGHWLQTRIAQGFPPMHQILGDVYANMIVGNSFRAAWELMCTHQKPNHRKDFEMVLQHVAFSQHKSGCTTQTHNELVAELCRIDREPHRARQRLNELRERCYLQFYFRRKSRQVTLQIRIQAVVLSILYMGLIIIQCVQRDWSKALAGCLFLSAIFFTLGLIGIYWILRRFKWRI